jgi:hypothetical protein|tara:strand:+ start:66 stop:278 length:213 start_codon:yes stop_codon:yes gene_type:complete
MLRKIRKTDRVSKYTGAELMCPHQDCNGSFIVYHLAWHGFTCINCGRDVKKYNWYIKKETMEERINNENC